MSSNSKEENITISTIKEILKDCEYVYGLEEHILDDADIETLTQMYNQYFDSLNQEIEEAKSVSDLIDLSTVAVSIIMPGILTVMGAGIIVVKGRKKHDEE